MVGKNHPQVSDVGGKPMLQLLYHVSGAFRPGVLTACPACMRLPGVQRLRCCRCVGSNCMRLPCSAALALGAFARQLLGCS